MLHVSSMNYVACHDARAATRALLAERTTTFTAARGVRVARAGSAHSRAEAAAAASLTNASAGSAGSTRPEQWPKPTR